MLKYIVFLYGFLVVFYFVVSMSFIYVKSIGISQILCLAGVVLGLITRSHFSRQYLKIKHLELVKNLVVEE